MKTKMITLLAAITITVNVSTASGRTLPTPKPVCGISTVSYRFVGEPGFKFEYAGDSYRVPATGSIELIADKRATEYRVGERALPLNVWPQDDFGTRTVPLPSHAAQN